MRVTFLLPTVGLSGGIRVVSIYARWLSDHGHQVVLVSQAAAPPSWKQRVKSLIKGNGWLKYKAQPTSHLDDLKLEHRVMLAGKIAEPDDVPPADVLISTWWETAEWAAQLPADRGARVYLVQGHEIFDYLPRDRCEATYRLPFHKIVVSRWLADLMAERYSDPNSDLVPNGVDHQLFHAVERTRQNQPTVGILYHEAELKGVDVALNALEQVKRLWPNLKVIAFGGSQPSGIFKLPDYVELHVEPKQDALRHLYASCDVWLTTSRSEGFNLMALEAMACRTPVVSSRTGWPVEGVRDGVNGYLVNVDDPDAAACALIKVLGLNDEDWMKMSEQAFATVEKSSWESSCKSFEQALYRATDRAGKNEVVGMSIFDARSR